LVKAITVFEDRFLDKQDRQFLLLIIKSLSSGHSVEVQIKNDNNTTIAGSKQAS